MFINYIIDGNTKSEKTKFSLLYKLDFFRISNFELYFFFGIFMLYCMCICHNKIISINNDPF